MMARAQEIPGITADATFGEAAASAVAVRAGEVFALSGSVLDMSDIEGVHDMRVATRRLRAAMEVYAPAFPRKAYEAALADVKALADDLGARRDPDVAIEELQKIESGLAEEDRPGVDSLVASLSARQAKGNERLAARLELVAETKLEQRLISLSEMARGSRRT